MVRRLKVLFLTAEAAPWVQVGGLGEMAGSLAQSLASRSLELRLAVPLYPWLSLADQDPGPRIEFDVPGLGRPAAGGMVSARHGRAQIWWMDGDPIRTARSVYADPADDAPRFLFFVRAALEACRAVGWKPDILHFHDWHTAPGAVPILRMREADSFWSGVRTLVTIHNLPYLGVGGESAVRALGWARDADSRLPDWARALPLPVGLSAADGLSTVSPTYAREIQTPEFGAGLSEFLLQRSGDLTGILNGIDTRRWDPASDPALVARYSVEDLGPRRANKAALRQELGLLDTKTTLLLGMVTRLDPQKGVDLVLRALEALREEPWELVLLGSGAPDLEALAQAFRARHPDRVALKIGFDSGLSRRIYSSADILLVPSRYEPCGVAQMIAMRYGALPLVRATGGLKDTVRDAEERGGTGFVFGPAEPDALAACVLRAIRAFGNRRRWRAMQLRAMAQDFSWARSAAEYLALYRSLHTSPSVA
ncbi:MAG: glycogen/starch synthase [Anaerolineales bacterium]